MMMMMMTVHHHHPALDAHHQLPRVEYMKEDVVDAGGSPTPDAVAGPEFWSEPLLESSSSIATTTTTTTTPMIAVGLPLISGMLGMMVAWQSQEILRRYLWWWSASSSSLSWAPLLAWSLLWSLWSCLLIFSILYAWLTILSSRCQRPRSDGVVDHDQPPEDDDDDDEQDEQQQQDWMFTMEAAYILGAIPMIAVHWFLHDLAFLWPHQVGPVLLVSVTLYAALLRFVWNLRFFPTPPQPQPNNNESLPTKIQTRLSPQQQHPQWICYQIVAALLGLFVGVTSQLLLAALLVGSGGWTVVHRNNNEPGLGWVRLVAFSVVWSLATVVLTFVGCVSLRSLVSATTTSTHHHRTPAVVEDLIMIQRLLIRMEAVHVLGSLLGICSAWIVLDVLLNLPQQIGPSVAMYLASLVAFGVIVRCFPEQDCIVDHEVVIQVMDPTTTTTEAIPEQQEERV